MVTITLFKVNPLPKRKDVLKKLKGRKDNFWFEAKISRFNENEVQIDIWFEESVELGLKRAFSDEAYEVLEYLKMNGKERILRKVYCFLNLDLALIEIYRGLDNVTWRIKEIIEKSLEVSLTPLSLDSGQLIHLIAKHSVELKQAMFKNVHGLWYNILRGRHLEDNVKFKDLLVMRPECLRVISIVPRIKYLNGNGYMVTINGDKGTIKMSNGLFKWKPRLEVRQIVSLIANVAKLPPLF